jgi:hypothetical protein
MVYRFEIAIVHWGTHLSHINAQKPLRKKTTKNE